MPGKAWRHLCHAIPLDRAETESLLASGEIVLLAIPKREGPGKNSHWLAIKRPTKVSLREQQFVVPSASDGVDVIESYRLYVARCAKVPDYYHLFVSEEGKRIATRLREGEDAIVGAS